MSDSDLPAVDELLSIIDNDIAEAKSRMEAYDERAAIRADALDDGLTTEQRAIAALQLPDTAWGKHAVASAWLKADHSHLGIFSKKDK